MEKVLYLFHHIHHVNGEHEVHHCGGEHRENDPRVDYQIEHCSCGKHRINKDKAAGHDFDDQEVAVSFTEICPDGGWHVESGRW